MLSLGNLRILFGCLAAAAWLGLTASAATFTWNGSSANWSTGANWVGGSAPPNDGTADILMTGSTWLTPNVDAAWSINKLTFDGSSGVFVLGGSQLTIGAGGIAQQDGDTQTVNNAIQVGATQTWNRSGGVLILNGNLTGTATVNVTNGTANAIRLGGSNSGFTGAFNLQPGDQSAGLLRPSAMLGGNVDMGGNNASFYLEGTGSPGTYTFGVGTGAGQVKTRLGGWGGIGPSGADVTWDPGNSGDSTLTYGGLDFGAPLGGSWGFTFGNSSSRLVLSGGSKTIYGRSASNTPCALTIMNFALGDDGTARDVNFAGTSLVLTRQAGGGHVGDSLAGATTISSNGSVAITNTNQIFSGNLNLSGGTLILDGISWSVFTAARPYGTIAGTYQLTGGGFAARGSDLTITSGTWDNKDIRFGSLAYYNGALYADKAVTLAVPVNLGSTTTRNIVTYGRVNESLTNWSVVSPGHEISGKVSGTLSTALNFSGFGGSGWSDSGVVRFTNATNDFTAPVNVYSGAVAVFASDGAFGNAANVITATEGGGGCAGLVLLEDTNAGGSTTFTKAVAVNATTDASGGMAGFGSYAGEVIYTGTATFTGSSGKTNAPIHVQSGSLQLGTAGTPGTFTNSRGATLSYNKGGAGELLLQNPAYAGASSWKWVLYQGTLTTILDPSHTANPGAGQLAGTGNAPLGNIFAAGTYAARTWHIAGESQAYTSAGGGSAHNNMTVLVDPGLTLTTSLQASDEIRPADGETVYLYKAGAGTWVYTAPSGQGYGDASLSSRVQLDQGILDTNGRMGRFGFRLSGGTLLSGTNSNLAGSSYYFDIDADGGKVGISTGAAGDVNRSGTITSWTQGTAPVTLAARNNYNLIFSNAAFPDINAGSTLLIERDGSGTGEVQIYDTAVTVNGTIGGSGRLQMGSAATGTLTVAGTLAPGSSPGTLTVDGNLTLANNATYAWELGPGGVADSTSVTGAVGLGANTILRVIGYQWVPASAAAQLDLFTWSGADPAATNWILDWSQAGNLYGGSVVVDTTANRAYITGLIPEPGALLLLTAGLLGLARRRR